MVWERLNIHERARWNTLELRLTSYTKINIKWIPDLMQNVKIILLEETEKIFRL